MFLFISYFSTQEFSLVVAFSYSALHIVFIVYSIQAGVIHRLAVQPGEKKCTVDIGFRHANIPHFSEKRIIHFIHLRRSQGGCLPTRLVRQPTCRNEILEQRVQRQTRLNYAESRQNPTKRKYLIFAQQRS